MESDDAASLLARVPQAVARFDLHVRAQDDIEVISMFDTDNWETDRYGRYDADFAWITNEPWYMDWSDVESAWTNDYEVAPYDIFGYGERGEWELWDG
jgi:hypothetical protein